MGKDVKEIDAVTLNMYLSAYPDQHGYYTQHKGDEVVTSIKEMARNVSVEGALCTIKKLTLLREYEKVGFGTKDIYNTALIDPVEISEERKKFDIMTEVDIRNIVKSKMDLIHENMAIDTGEMYSFHAGEDILDLLRRCKEEPTWGHSFQSKIFNRVFRGLLGKKVMIRSGSTGSGKTRQMIGDMANISAKMMYDNSTHTWVENHRPVSSTFITTELDKDEVQLILLATISGVAEDIIKDGHYTSEVEEKLHIAGEIIRDSEIHFEFASNFSMTDLESLIEKNINRHDTGFVFFDYIQITPKFAQELRKVFGYDLREDQMLNLMVSCLKNIANKFDIFILTATQVNRSHKSDEYPDATHLRGGQATADKADYGIITMRITQKDKEKLEKLMSKGNFDCPMPTHGHHVFKNRGGKYTGVIIWVNMNLDNMTVQDCFVTTQDFDQLYVEPKEL
ncbi:DnaB-like helicase C-terminal domain-containing protein [Romboutsia sp.]|uniref:DnaB-like helicase C-terminal domain-containing protein n=1 Tax=Romboutsia sp. TaxID=1965302 RepID=UPI002BA37B4A|nr:DnaB-like helicase C-terminal domain-containing protein [Romboutsia sp.]HSQ88002.1 DnaB-like helicase C-terminal domain-containing protein [Romboutsia sp.]